MRIVLLLDGVLFAVLALMLYKYLMTEDLIGY